VQQVASERKPPAAGAKRAGKRKRRRMRFMRRVFLLLLLLAAGALLGLAAVHQLQVQTVPAIADAEDMVYTPEPDDALPEAAEYAEGRTQPLVGVTPSEGPPYTIALDAGHGGNDVGATGLSGDEVTMTEATVAALYALLEEDPNFIPVLCRDYGEGADSTQRAQVAADSGAHVLLSIHGNSDASASTYGFECYTQLPGRANYTNSLRLGRCLAVAMSAQGQRMRGEGGVRYLYYVGSDETGWSKQVVEASDTTVRNEETFGILEKSPCPAVLIEQCFLTNASDVSAWTGTVGCQRAAQVYYQALLAYFGLE
jgi:N-acetylmuramoyl-L-alanine amidase